MKSLRILALASVIWLFGCTVCFHVSYGVLGAMISSSNRTAGMSQPSDEALIARLNELRCPLALGTNERGTIVAIISNPTATDRRGRLDFDTTGFLTGPIEPDREITILANETIEVTLTVSASNAGERNILAWFSNLDPAPSSLSVRTLGNCGIFVENTLGLPAGVVAILGALGILSGATIIARTLRTNQHRRR